ncbi:MAG TPA: helix-turn-helix transcriptional regulator [Candidatus Obscuribacterales bacterium]
MYHFPAGFRAEACRNDLDAESASILLRTVHETFKNREAYVISNYYLFIVLKGKKVFHVTADVASGEESGISVEPGQALLIRKGACLSCEIERLDEGAFEAVMFLMDEPFIAAVLQKYAISVPQGLSSRSLCRLDVAPYFQACIESLLPYFMQRSPRHQALIQLKMEELLLNLLESEQLPQLLGVLADAALSRRGPYLELIESWIAAPQTIEQMAASLHQSPTAFKQEFKQLFGQPPAQYLQEKRLERAHQLILTSQQSMTQIALATGFESQSHFTQVFRRRYGCTPGKLKGS